MPEPRKLLLFPFGGNAREALSSVLAKDGGWAALGFFDDAEATWGKACCGVRVLGGRAVLEAHPDAYVLAVPGSPTTYLARRKTIESLGLAPERFATVVHPSAVVGPGASVGRNTLLMPHVVVSPGASVGDHCVVLPNTVISHESAVGAHTLIGSNVTVSGGVRIGENCYIGSGVKIRDGIRIGAGCLLGLGANVVSDVEDGVVAVGNPARPLRRGRA